MRVMNDDPVFLPAIKKGWFVMDQCPTRRSLISTISHFQKMIISTISHFQKMKEKTYSNKRWMLAFLGDNDFSVLDRNSGQKYLVIGFITPGYERPEYIVYKKGENA